MHEYVFIYTLVPGIWALAVDILAVAPFWLKRQRLTAPPAKGKRVARIVKPKKTVHKLKRCSTQATFAYHRQIHNVKPCSLLVPPDFDYTFCFLLVIGKSTM